MEKPVQEYRNEKIVVKYDPRVCTHAANCVQSLPTVFDSKKKPWINVEGAQTDQIIEAVKGCPSGALSFETP